MTDALYFSKFQGCGNDFICVDCRETDVLLDQYCVDLCRRRFGIGADGIIGLYQSDVADIKMVIINPDGSIPEMCGNGLRCLVAFARRQRAFSKSSIVVETGAGVLSCDMLATSADTDQLRIDMGVALFEDTLPRSDFLLNTNQRRTVSIMVQDQAVDCVPISMGNPHAVIFVDDVQDVSVQTLGPIIESNALFPNNVNVEFVEVVSDSRLSMRVWERGAGETLACGTGACASVVAGVLMGRCRPKTSVRLPGGMLEISVNSDTYSVSMSGPATHVFSGSIQR